MFGDDFDRRREKANREMDAHFNRASRFALAGLVITVCGSIGALGFIGWVVVKVMQHFGVI